MVIQDPLAERAATSPDRSAVIDPQSGSHRSYRELNAAVSSLADRLPPIDPGDRVGLVLRTSIDAVRAIHAVWRLGGVVVPLSPDQPAETLEHRLEAAEAAVTLGPTSGATPLPSAVDLPRPSTEDASAPTAGEPAGWSWTDPMVILFTSGTSGKPKPVPLTLANLVASAAASAFRLGVVPEDNWLCCLPIHHMGGLAPVFRSTVYGTAVTVHEGFDVGAIDATIGRHAPTGVSLVPTQLKRLLDADVDLRALRFVLLGGAPAGTALIERCEAEEVPVYPTYGLTETASQVTTATPEEAFSHPGTVGRPLIGTTVTIVDDDGDTVSAGQPGEIVVDGPTVTPGYAGDVDGRYGRYGLHTGDVGYLKDDRLWVTGRLSDVIISGGEQIHPREVETAIRSHPSVDDAAVIGIDDPDWGERVGAVVVAEAATEADLDTHLRDRLAPFKVPKTWAFTDDLPRTQSGTVDRAAIRRLLRGVNTDDDQ